MRDYAKVSPKAWHGETFKTLRKGAPEGLVVALYLMTSPSSNMLGLFSQPILYMAHETGLGLEGAWKGLNACIEAGFCEYDESSEFVWVAEMAAYQIANELKTSDNRCAGIQKEYDALSNNPFLGQFFDRYEAAFHLSNRRDYISPLEAPPKPRTRAGAGTRAGVLAPPAPNAPPSAPPPDRSAQKTREGEGTRLAKDWQLPDDWREWCREHRPDLDPDVVAESFRDFWVAKAGKDGRKADWQATWRNWCRSQKSGSRRGGDGGAADWTGAAQ